MTNSLKRVFMFSLFALPAAGCAVADGPSTTSTAGESFEEFEANTYREPWDGGVYIVNGDTPIVDEKALYEF